MSPVSNAAVTLIGPGGAGKSTVGMLLAERLGLNFFDLDRQFEARFGDISEFIDGLGYRAYTRHNVELYASSHVARAGSVAALSSGFMTYDLDVHPDYAIVRAGIERSAATFVLIPSLDCERAVAETVRRQLERPFARSAAREEAVIRQRFPIYLAVRAPKVETMRPLSVVVDELAAAVGDPGFAPRSHLPVGFRHGRERGPAAKLT